MTLTKKERLDNLETRVTAVEKRVDQVNATAVGASITANRVRNRVDYDPYLRYDPYRSPYDYIRARDELRYRYNVDEPRSPEEACRRELDLRRQLAYAKGEVEMYRFQPPRVVTQKVVEKQLSHTSNAPTWDPEKRDYKLGDLVQKGGFVYVRQTDAPARSYSDPTTAHGDWVLISTVKGGYVARN